jgi:methyl-accepting chemotaxis protein
MDILFNLDTSLYWKIPLGLLLLVLSIFFIWLTFRIRKTLKSVEALLDENVFNLLKAIQELAVIYRDVSNVAGSLLSSLDRTVTALNRELPQLLETTKRIAASIRQISDSEIQPTIHNIQEITETVNQNIAKIDGLVDTVKDASQTTISHAEYYRDQLAGSVTRIISTWSAIKAGWEVFRHSGQSHTSDSEDTT